MKIVIHPKYAYLSDFIHRIPSLFEQEGTIIYVGRNLIKTFDVEGQVLNVKRFKRPHPLNRLVYTLFRPSKARRAYTYALRLLEKGIETPEPVAYILCKEGGVLGWSYFISIQVPASYHTLYEISQGPLVENEDVFQALGGYTAHLHQKGVYHKDYSPGNILYRRDCKGVRFVLIDINRMSFGAVSLRRGCANFARIWGREAAFRILAESYADTLRVDRERCVRLVLRYRKTFWHRYARKHPVKFEM
ncbi:lipopolysaccharide kinase InaA family protein [Parabacteroides sp. ZJ-118]|uniref:lipopolysaccharide kinase InaA family protein n=1 Tax=Parabacteroides sp. ZJ-118 TaxID=2709398 RepID=UPI0013EB5399|nr:lipopolysaccharide kinase InaA family protein [Parabacteroides sp. ZJ-118]